MDNQLVRILIPFGILAALIIAVEVGHRIGWRKMRTFPSDQKIETGSIQGAMLGLLGLLLGFSFAGASARHIERQDLIAREANAIGTAYRRADLLNQSDADELKAALLAYLNHRVVISRTLHSSSLHEQDAETISADHNRIWAAASKGADAKPAALNMVVSSINEVLDLHDYRVAAGRKHLPALVLALLGTCSVLTLGVMGFASALGRHRNTLMTSSIAILVGALLWTTIDLDRSRIGLVRVSDIALIELQKSLNSGIPPK